MLNITELKAKAASNNMSIVDAADGLYQIYSNGNKLGSPVGLEQLQASDYWGVFDEVEEFEAEQEVIEFVCTNGSNSSFRVMAVDADAALDIAVERFDSDSDYVLPINVQSECGVYATLDEPITISYTADELGLNDDF